MYDCLKIIPGVLSDLEIDEIIKDTLPKVSEQNVVHFAQPAGYEGIKKAPCVDHRLIPQLIDRLGFSRDQLDIASFMFYAEGSENKPHADNCIFENNQVKQIKPWTHTAVIFLNDNFSGGSLVYPKQGCLFTSIAGNCVIASAGAEYPHHVTPVLSGNRLTLVLRLIVQNCPLI